MREIYIPVMVTLDDDGKPVSARADFEGAPWSYVDKQENVWNPHAEEWTRDQGAEVIAETYLDAMLEKAGGENTAMRAVLLDFEATWGEAFDNDEPINGGDAVDAICELLPRVREALKRGAA